MISQEIKKIIENNTLALATCDKKGNPHVIAIACVKLINNELIITNNFMKTTIENIKQNNNVSLAVWDNERGYSIEGTAEYFSEGKWLNFIKNLPENKGLPTKGAILVKINSIKRLVG